MAGVSNYQPSLVVSELLMKEGTFPGSGPDVDGISTMGMVRIFAGNFEWDGASMAAGQLLPVAQNTALFTLLQGSYGYDGINSNFALPDLVGHASVSPGQGYGLPNTLVLGEEMGQAAIALTQANLPHTSGGSGQSVDNNQPALAVNYLIRVSNEGTGGIEGTGNGDFLGGIVKFAGVAGGGSTPAGYLLADGRLLDIDDYPALWNAIGTTYGGDGQTTFALPDLRGRTPVGANGTFQLGEAFGGDGTVELTTANMPANMGGSTPASNYGPSLALNYIICIDPDAPYPPRDGGTQANSDQAYLGEIQLFALNGPIPAGWALCDGATLGIAANTFLFSVLGTTYGGNGQTNFQLPDFRGYTDVGAGGQFQVGETFGAASLAFTSADIPALNIVGDGTSETFFGGDGNDTIDGAGGNDTITGGAGVDSLIGGDGSDTFIMIAEDDIGDTIDGGADPGTNDILRIDAAGRYDFTGTAITNIDQLDLDSNAGPWTIILSDSLMATAHYYGSGTLYISGGTPHGLTLDASAVSAPYGIHLDGPFLQGDDSITGGAGADTITTGAGNDTIDGGGGNDSINGGADNDSINGGAGNDTIVAGAGLDTIYGGLGADVIILDSPPDLLDYLSGTSELATNDTLRIITAGDYTLANGILNFDIVELAGDQADWTLTVSNEFMAFTGYNGVIGRLRIEATTAISHDVTIDASVVTGPKNIIVGGLLNGDDSITGGAGKDVIDSGAGADTVNGGAGDDTISGGAGIDSLIGGTGNDTFILADAGDLVDTIEGEAETHDTLQLDSAGSYDFTGRSISGIDFITLSNDTADWTIILSEEVVTTANSLGRNGIVRIDANSVLTHDVTIDAHDLVTGRIDVTGAYFGGADLMIGGAGIDEIEGGAGNDTIDGGAGSDVITGGTGVDSLTGGAGSDLFVITNTADIGDTIDGTDGASSNDGLFIVAAGSYDFTATNITNIDQITLSSTTANADWDITLGDDLLSSANYGGTAGVFLIEDVSTSTHTIVIDANSLSAPYSILVRTGNSADSITGGAGNDTITAGGGNDTITGGGGTDVAMFSGNWSGYNITNTGGTTYLIIGPDGTDTVTGVETFIFNGTSIAAANLLNVAPDAGAALSVTGLIEDGASAASGNLLANATDANTAIGDVLRISEVQSALPGSVAVPISGDTDIVGKFGTLTVHADGTYDYALDNNDADTQALASSQTGHDVFTFKVSDIHDLFQTADIDFAVTGTNDAPTGADKTITILEDGTPYTFAAADFGFADAEGDSLQSVIITTLPAAGTLKLNGVAVTLNQTIAAGAIGTLVFTPAANGNGSPYGSFGFKVVDTGGTANGGHDTDAIANTIRFDVTGVNDAPSGADKTITMLEDGARAFAASDFGFTDIDGNTLQSVLITSLPGAGTLKLNGVAVTANQTIAAGAIGTLVFTPAANGNGNNYASFGFKLVDTGGTANGGHNTDPTANTITFNVTPVNDAPSGADKTITIAEDGARALAASDFGFADIDGNTLQSVIITSLPGAGTLKLNGVAVTANQTIAAGAIGLLVFTPAANANGNNYASFGFKLVDTGGTANGGHDTDPTANAITFNVTPVNDAPVITSNGGNPLALSLAENSAAVTTIVASDVDSTIAYSLSGADAALFNISNTGIVTFKLAPDFETPKDAGANNIYNLIVRASDGTLSDTQALTITVTNIKGSTANGTAAADTISLTQKAPGGKFATNEEDRIDGKAGNDKLSGAGGNDTLIGGAGKDTLDGGAGADTFVFNAKIAPNNIDTIKSFAHDIDTIQLAKGIFSTIGPSLSSGEFYSKAGAVQAHDANDRIIYDKTTGKLYYDDDGKGGHAAVLFATLSDKPATLDHADFSIV